MAWNRLQPPTTQPPVSTAPQGKPKIMIAVPHESRVYTEWAFKMLGPLMHVPVPWCDKVPQMARGVPLNVARDQLAEAMLADKTVTHIMWVDSDSICSSPPNPNDAMQMLFQCNQPIVSGLYRAKQKDGFNYAMWMDAKLPEGKLGFLPIQSFTGNWLQVDTVGMGFILVQRKVYETLPQPWHPWPTKSPSEDFNFCIAARKAGFSINVFTEVKLRHLGEMGVNLDGTITVLEV